MRRVIVTIVISASALVLAVPALGRVDELAALDKEPLPSCPTTPCAAISRTTGYQVKVGTAKGVFVAPRDGRVVAWTVRLSKPSAKQVSFFNETLGGEASATIAVLRPGNRLRYRVVGQGEVVKLAPYFGTTVQFPLLRTLTVRKGWVIALSVPTWAPALAVDLPKAENAWRASRPKDGCQDPRTQTAQSRGDLSQYYCLYRGVRLTYSATIVSAPQAAAPDKPAAKKPAAKPPAG